MWVFFCFGMPCPPALPCTALSKTKPTTREKRSSPKSSETLKRPPPEPHKPFRSNDQHARLHGADTHTHAPTGEESSKGDEGGKERSRVHGACGKAVVFAIAAMMFRRCLWVCLGECRGNGPQVLVGKVFVLANGGLFWQMPRRWSAGACR